MFADFQQKTVRFSYSGTKSLSGVVVIQIENGVYLYTARLTKADHLTQEQIVGPQGS